MARNTRNNNNNNNNNNVAAMAAGMEAVKLSVIIQKAKGGTMTTLDANTVATVTAETLVTAAAFWPALCLNMMADKVDPAIVKAAKKRGGLARLFGGKLCDPDIKALKVILEVDAPTRQAAWLAYVTKAKVIRTISLSGLSKAVKLHNKDDDGDKALTFKEKLAQWCAENDGGRELPASLFDLLVEADVITTDEGAAKE